METTTNGGTQRRGSKDGEGGGGGAPGRKAFYFVGQWHRGALEVCHNKKHQGGILSVKQQTFNHLELFKVYLRSPYKWRQGLEKILYLIDVC